MKDYDLIILVAGGIIVCSALYFGFMKVVAISFQSPKTENATQERKISDQQRRLDEIKERQRRLRDQQEQTMRDYRRKNR